MHADDGWQSLFDGRSLGQWKPTEFGGEGVVTVDDDRIVLAMGANLTGVTWTGDVPAGDYEIELQAMRLAGSDFFCGLTFPVHTVPGSSAAGAVRSSVSPASTSTTPPTIRRRRIGTSTTTGGTTSGCG